MLRKRCAGILGLVLFAGIVTGTAQPALAATLLAPMPLISGGLPAYTSDDCFTSRPASNANSGNYSLPWRSCDAPPSISSPVTLTYDISSIPADRRADDVLAWFNDYSTGNYNPTLNSNPYYNTPKDYAIQGNTAAGGSSPPASGWTTLSTVTNNVYHSRQIELDLHTYNWVRLSFTSSNGTDPNGDISVSMDLHDASGGGITDDWIFYGDSITQSGLLNDDTYGQSFAQQINALNSDYFPLAESGGIGGFTSSDALANIGDWLPLFPGKFVALNYGTNDANINASAATFYTNMATMVQDILGAGKVPVIPTIPWGCTTNLTANVPTFNAKIQQLYDAYPEIIEGPDLYTYFQNNQSYIANNDCIHPEAPDGWTAYREQWAQAMAAAVYTSPAASITPGGGSVSTAQSVTLSSTKPGKIYYTTDGSTPTTASAVYGGALAITSSSTVKALAVDQAGNQSDVVSATYTFPTGSSGSSGSSGGTGSHSSSSSSSSHPTTSSGSQTAATTTHSTSDKSAGSPTGTIKPPVTRTESPGTIRTVLVTVSDGRGKPLQNLQIALEGSGQTATTNANGVAIFYNVMPGTYTLRSSDNRYTGSERVAVTAASSGDQTITFTLAAKATKHSRTALITGGTVLCILLLGALFFVLRRRRRNQAPSVPPYVVPGR